MSHFAVLSQVKQSTQMNGLPYAYGAKTNI